MVNVFGDREVGFIVPQRPPGHAGPPGSPGAQGTKRGKGDPGKSGFDAFWKWMPNLALVDFRKEEVGCFLLTDSNTDEKREGKKGITEWYSRSLTKMNAVAESGKECKRLVHIKDGYNALIFDNSLYAQDDIIITPFTPWYVCICATFSVEGESDQIIVTDFGPDNPDVQFRGISAIKKEVGIWGATTDSKYVPIKHESKEGSWTTVWIEWKNVGDCRSLFYINGAEIQGVFSSKGIRDFDWW